MAHEFNSAAERPLVEALTAYVVFCGLCVVSRFIPPWFFLVIICGSTFPLIWGRVAKEGRERCAKSLGPRVHKVQRAGAKAVAKATEMNLLTRAVRLLRRRKSK